jgi:hypothetical protein
MWELVLSTGAYSESCNWSFTIDNSPNNSVPHYWITLQSGIDKTKSVTSRWTPISSIHLGKTLKWHLNNTPKPLTYWIMVMGWTQPSSRLQRAGSHQWPLWDVIVPGVRFWASLHVLLCASYMYAFERAETDPQKLGVKGQNLTSPQWQITHNNYKTAIIILYLIYKFTTSVCLWVSELGSSQTDDRARPGKNGRGADWLWRWPAWAGWARESPCRSCACWARERGWLPEEESIRSKPAAV